MSPEAKKFFDDRGTPTAGEVMLVEAALVSGRKSLAAVFGNAFYTALRGRFRPDFRSLEEHVAKQSDIEAAFAEAKKAIGL